MALSHKLELRQSQSLVMTPQLMQAIKLLQLSNLDLIAYVEAELERNPLLERPETGDGAPDPDDRGEAEAAGDRNGQESDGDDREDWLETRLEVDPDAISAKLDTDLANVFPDDHGRGSESPATPLPAENWASTPTRQPISSRGLQSRGVRRRASSRSPTISPTSLGWRPRSRASA